VFVYYRGAAGGEDRLKGKLSIGVGGHVDIVPVAPTTLASCIEYEAKREIMEEIGLEPLSYEVSRIIYNPEDAVGRVHLGLLGFALVEGDVVQEEGQIEKGEWVPVVLLKSPEYYDRLEPWSKMAVDHMHSTLAAEFGTKYHNPCFLRAGEFEPIFVLRSTDPAAPGLVRQWAEQYRAAHCTDDMWDEDRRRAKYEDALAVADRMEKFPVKKTVGGE
jgi:ADP-ribose pyrophosphatase YjhB (NUDIX family)